MGHGSSKRHAPKKQLGEKFLQPCQQQRKPRCIQSQNKIQPCYPKFPSSILSDFNSEQSPHWQKCPSFFLFQPQVLCSSCHLCLRVFSPQFSGIRLLSMVQA